MSEPRVIEFTIPGQPRGKQRARTVRCKSFVRTYTPEQTVRYENLVALCFKQAAPGHKPIDGPVDMRVSVIFAVPKSYSRARRKELLGTYCPMYCDGSNVVKIVEDGLNGVAWVDDRQVVLGSWSKMWSEQPGVEVTIRWGGAL